ncbi:queuosine 5'-phosphate N-glycosylase/hydrolase [Euwallacea fornicatus]|uniref:queuosine 5'-phosphate N-glycosylase/hydrolase n=1 Tax=Euwallacea fornicatus TaxID=995702 RepID=UPI00338F5780
MHLSPKESGLYIANHSNNVTIKLEGITKLGDVLFDELNSGQLKPENFSQTEVHPKAEDKHALDWLFVVDTLNFCFWSNEREEGWKVEGHSGYYALCAAINRALKDNIDILNPKFYSSLTEAQLKNILRSDTKVEVPLLSERLKCLHEVGTALLKNFEGSFKIVVRQSENSAKKLLELIVSNFMCFQDVATYKGQKVAYYKRAQILVGDVWACFQGQGLGYFKDLDEITMFADYRVPQTLLWFGVIEYGEHINKKLKENYIFNNGDLEEQEIRGCSIHAVELLKVYVNERLKDKKINSILIDHFLWDFRRKHAKEIEEKGLPFHKVFCIYY